MGSGGIQLNNLREQGQELSFALVTVEQISSSCVFSPDLLIPVMLAWEFPHIPLLLWNPRANTAHMGVLVATAAG